MSEKIACDHEINTADGGKDTCSKAQGHNGDHVGTISKARAEEARKAKAAAFQTWRAEHDPEFAAKAEARRQKKIAQLEALAAELGYKVTPPKA
jgi:hypothetical protein